MSGRPGGPEPDAERHWRLVAAFHPRSAQMTTALEMLVGGEGFGVMAVLLGEFGRFDLRDVTMTSGVAWLYQVAIGGVVQTMIAAAVILSGVAVINASGMRLARKTSDANAQNWNSSKAAIAIRGATDGV